MKRFRGVTWGSARESRHGCSGLSACPRARAELGPTTARDAGRAEEERRCARVCSGMTLPKLAFLPDHRQELVDALPEAFESIGKYFDLKDDRNDAAMENARAVATALEGVVHSSDTDCDYYPCVLSGADPESDAFFAALGVARDARFSVGGYDNPKLEVVRAGSGEGERSALALISRLGEYELGNISDDLEAGDPKAIGAAIAKLEALGPIVGVQLCADDHATKLVLTLAKSGDAYVGVAVVRVET